MPHESGRRDLGQPDLQVQPIVGSLTSSGLLHLAGAPNRWNFTGLHFEVPTEDILMQSLFTQLV